MKTGFYNRLEDIVLIFLEEEMRREHRRPEICIEEEWTEGRRVCENLFCCKIKKDKNIPKVFEKNHSCYLELNMVKITKINTSCSYLSHYEVRVKNNCNSKAVV